MTPHAVSSPAVAALQGAAIHAFLPAADAPPVEQRPGMAAGSTADEMALPALDAERLVLAVHAINNAMHIRSIGVQFHVDDASDRTVVRVVDRDSGTLIRQIPSEEALRLSILLNPAPVMRFRRND